MKMTFNYQQWREIGKQAGWTEKIAATCKECNKECDFDDCVDEAGVFKGCPACGSKNIKK